MGDSATKTVNLRELTKSAASKTAIKIGLHIPRKVDEFSVPGVLH